MTTKNNLNSDEFILYGLPDGTTKNIRIPYELNEPFFEYKKKQTYNDKFHIKCKLCGNQLSFNIKYGFSTFKTHLKTDKHRKMLKRFRESQLNTEITNSLNHKRKSNDDIIEIISDSTISRDNSLSNIFNINNKRGRIESVSINLANTSSNVSTDIQNQAETNEFNSQNPIINVALNKLDHQIMVHSNTYQSNQQTQENDLLKTILLNLNENNQNYKKMMEEIADLKERLLNYESNYKCIERQRDYFKNIAKTVSELYKSYEVNNDEIEFLMELKKESNDEDNTF